MTVRLNTEKPVELDKKIQLSSNNNMQKQESFQNPASSLFNSPTVGLSPSGNNTSGNSSTGGSFSCVA